MNARPLSALDPSTVAPAATGRLVGLDVARAFAIIGMVWVNFRMTLHHFSEAPAIAQVLDGRAAALFVTLAGVGVSLMARRTPTAEVRRLLWKRAAVLWVFGMAWSPVWIGDILHYYGVWLAMAALLVTVSSRALLGLAAVLPVVATGMLLTLDYTQGWDFTELTYTDFWTLGGQLRNLFFNGLHPTIPWLSFLLVGMVVGRAELTDTRLQRRMVVGGLGMWATTELLSKAVVAATTPAIGADVAPHLFGTNAMPPSLPYMVAAGSLAIAVIGASQWFVQQRPFGLGTGRPTRALTHLGQLSLSVYIVHVFVVVVGHTLFFGAPLATVVLPAALLFVALALPAADQWRQHHRRGPFEQLLRKVTG